MIYYREPNINIFATYFYFSGSEVRVRCCAQLRGDPRHYLHLPPGHVRPLRHRDPRQHLLLHARLSDTQVGHPISLSIIADEEQGSHVLISFLFIVTPRFELSKMKDFVQSLSICPALNNNMRLDQQYI